MLDVGPTHQKNVQSIENVQRRAARFVKKCNQRTPGAVCRHKFTRGPKMVIIGTEKETNKINKLVQDRKWHPGSSISKLLQTEEMPNKKLPPT